MKQIIKCWYGYSQGVAVWFADLYSGEKRAEWGTDIPIGQFQRHGEPIRLTLNVRTQEIVPITGTWEQFRSDAKAAGLDASTSQPLFGRPGRPENIAMEALIRALAIGFDPERVEVKSATLDNCLTTIPRLRGPLAPTRDYDLLEQARIGRDWADPLRPWLEAK